MKIEDTLAEIAQKAYELKLLKLIKTRPPPKHIAIIMDGNRRYAKMYGLDLAQGYRKGKEKLEEVLTWCLELNIKIITVYAFSTENFNRDPDEIQTLMTLFYDALEHVLTDERIRKNKVKVKVIGRKELIPKELVHKIEEIENATKNYSNYLLNIALAYGGRDEIVDAIKDIAKKVKAGKLNADDITEETVSAHLYTRDIPDPDLLLRTSGEERISNFLLWQIAYSEIYFSDVYWPTFKKLDFLRAIYAYQLRKRRFGI